MRIRTIKPSVHTDEDLWDLEQETGLPIFRAFTGLWGAADREGRFEWRPRALKAAILPYWEGDFSRVLHALSTRGFIVQYACEGREYGLVRTFTKHQLVNNREAASTLPAPPETLVDPPPTTRGPRVPDASITPLVLARVEQEQEQEQEQSERRARAPECDSDLKVGNDFMLNATGLHWQMAEQELQLIGARPEPERLRALAAIRADPWCQANMRKCSPKHVLRKWNDYSSGSTKMQLVAAKPPELTQTELQKLYAKYTELSKAERECQFFEAEKKARIQARIAEVSSQIKVLKESDGKPQAQPA